MHWIIYVIALLAIYELTQNDTQSAIALAVLGIAVYYVFARST
jgi:hypothetical protein